MIFGTFPNRRITAGVHETPEFPIPADINGIRLTLSRENWPVAGVTIAIAVSIDNAQSWRWFDNFIPAFVPSVKMPNVADAPAQVIYAWNPEFASLRATHVKARVTSQTAFRADVTIEGFKFDPTQGGRIVP